MLLLVGSGEKYWESFPLCPDEAEKDPELFYLCHFS